MPLITLTRNQFLKRRPQGNYADYLKHIGTARAGRPLGQPTGKQANLPMDPTKVNQFILQNLTSGYLNPAQMRRQATQSVNDAIKTAIADLKAPLAETTQEAERQARGYEGFARALGEMRRSDAAYVQGLYGGAAADQARFAQALTGSVGAAAQADAAAQQAAVQAATGEGGYTGTDVPAMQNVGYFLGGQIPAAGLAENAAAAAQNELRQGIALAARLGIEGAGIRGKALDARREFERERAKLIMKRPGLVREAISDLTGEQRANLATLANVAYLQNAQAKTTEELTGMYQGQPSISTYIDARGVTRRYNPNTHRVKTAKDGTQFLEPLPVAKGKGGLTRNAAGFTPSEVATQTRMRNEAIQGGRAAMLGAVQTRSGPLWKPGNPLLEGFPGGEPTRRTYSEAKQYLLTNFANDLIKQYPGEKARVLRIVDEVLASAGFTKRATTKKTPATTTPPWVPRPALPGQVTPPWVPSR